MAVVRLARDFDWPHGEKRLIAHDQPLGLPGNIAFCGEMTQEFGSIILLEDDLYVSPAFYGYAARALDFYEGDERVAGIALNQLWFNGFTHQPFLPLLDGFDVFFLQLATPQGQAYSASQWAAYARWTSENPQPSLDAVHDSFARFPASDWLHIAAAYLAETRRYYVYPRQSLTTNFGDRGTHMRDDTAIFQVPVLVRPWQPCLAPLDESHAVYDGFFEIRPDRLSRLTGDVLDQPYDVDLYAVKSARHLAAEFVLTSRSAKRPLRMYGRAMRPMETNVIAGIEGTEIALARRVDVDLSERARLAAQRHNDDYFNRNQHPSLRQRAAVWLTRRR